MKVRPSPGSCFHPVVLATPLRTHHSSRTRSLDPHLVTGVSRHRREALPREPWRGDPLMSGRLAGTRLLLQLQARPGRTAEQLRLLHMVSATTQKMIAEPKTHSCKYTGRYTSRHMLTGTADFSIYARCTCFSNQPSGRGKRCRGSRESSPQT
jgi:hypothetical protein